MGVTPKRSRHCKRRMRFHLATRTPGKAKARDDAQARRPAITFMIRIDSDEYAQ